MDSAVFIFPTLLADIHRSNWKSARGSHMLHVAWVPSIIYISGQCYIFVGTCLNLPLIKQVQKVKFKIRLISWKIENGGFWDHQVNLQAGFSFFSSQFHSKFKAHNNVFCCVFLLRWSVLETTSSFSVICVTVSFIRG